MKKILTLVLMCTLFTTAVHAQYLDVASGLGNLDDAIKNDTLADGKRKDVNRIYRLARGGVYVLRGMVAFSGFDLRIEAAAGTGARPIILYQGGAVAINQLFEAKGNISFKGIHLTVRDLSNAIVERVIALSADNIRCTLTDCLADDVGQTVVRVNNANTKIYLTNSIISRAGRPQDPDNGRVIDKRGPSIDSLVIENCAIYNVTSRIFRDGGATNPCNFIKINQNTIWGVGQRGLAIGKVINLTITNNIFQNMAIFGSFKTATTPTFAIEVDTTFRGKTWAISNNNFSTNPQVLTALPVRGRGGLGDTLVACAFLNPRAAEVATKTTTEVITFRKAPVLPAYLVQDFRNDTTTATTRVNARNWDHSGLTKNTTLSLLTAGLDRFSESHDFGYGTWRAAHRGGTTGQPLGCNLFGFTTKTDDFFDASGVMLAPNPVSDKLTLGGLEAAKITQLQVINMAGQVLRVVDTEGVNFIEMPVQNLQSGLYILKMTNTEGKVSNRKFSKL